MSRPPPQKSSSSKRIDTASPGAALKQSPFAGLAEKVTVVPERPAASEPSPPSETKAAPRPSPGRLVLRRETKHRGGKTVVVIGGFAALRDHSDAKLSELEKHLKSRLGCGGTVELGPREILIQGDRPDEIASLLQALGYEVAGVKARPGAPGEPAAL